MKRVVAPGYSRGHGASVNAAGRGSAASTVHVVQWYVVCGLVAVCLVAVGGLTVCVYRCYRRRRFLAPRLASMSSGSSSSLGGKAAGRLSRDRSSGGLGPGDVTSSLVTKSPSFGSTTQSRAQPAAKYPGGSGAVEQGAAGQGSDAGGYGTLCQGQVVQTQCYIVNDKEQTLVRSPEALDEKRETTREKLHDDDVTTGGLGALQFTVGYDQERSILTVSVVSAKNLPVKNSTIGSSDPYIKLQLLPDKRQKVKTRVLRKTLNPVFDETFTFYGVDENQLTGITLHFVVLSFDRFSRDDIIGEVVYQLDEMAESLEASKKALVTVSREIIPRQIRLSGYSRGELLVSICHHPAASRLTVVILKARNLPKMDITGLADPYVKVYLTYNGQRIAKKKTHIKKRTLNPVFNESFIFDLPATDPTTTSPGGSGASSPTSAGFLAGVSLEMVVLDWDQMTKNEVIGRVEIGGAGSGEAEGRHWAEVVGCPRKQIASWHKLKE